MCTGSACERGEARDVVEPIGWDGSHAVGRDADADVVVGRVAPDEGFDVGEPFVERAVAEAELRPFGGFAGAAPRVDHAKERDAQARVLGCADDGVAHDGAIGVGRAVGLVVDVMELADGEHARRGELAVGDERDVVDRLGRERARESVHRLPPSPEIVGLALWNACEWAEANAGSRMVNVS
jgi:hypothetical protein